MDRLYKLAVYLQAKYKVGQDRLQAMLFVLRLIEVQKGEMVSKFFAPNYNFIAGKNGPRNKTIAMIVQELLISDNPYEVMYSEEELNEIESLILETYGDYIPMLLTKDINDLLDYVKSNKEWMRTREGCLDTDESNEVLDERRLA